LGGDPAAADGPLRVRIPVADLRRRPGERREVRREVDLAPVEVAGVLLGGDGRVAVDLVLESLSDGVVASGSVTVEWTGSCRRCLEPTGGRSIAEVHEVFKDRPDEQGDPSAGAMPVEGDGIDLGPVIHDAAVLALPLAPLCDPSCRGPLPDDLPVATGDDPVERVVDPRWAALDELRFDEDEQGG